MEKNLHQIDNPQIDIDTAWTDQQSILIDVRAPKEYTAGYIPSAINVPLLENSEQQEIGILYKHFGQEKAIDKGYEFFESKLQDITAQFRKLPADKQLIVYCARGGMRSQVITSFLRYLGYPTRQLTGGYKAFRNWNLDRLNRFQFRGPIILHGQTGVGKTLVLKQLANHLDLEGIARHRGSIFGGIGKSPVTQKTFEAHLLVCLDRLDNAKPVFIEGESRKVGDVSIPDNIFSQMRKGRALLLEASMETRVKRTIEEYIEQQPHALPRIRSTIQQLSNDLGKKPVARLIDLFDNENYAECFEYILKNYYDRKYAHSMKKLAFAKRISSEDVQSACTEINQFAAQLAPSLLDD